MTGQRPDERGDIVAIKEKKKQIERRAKNSLEEVDEHHIDWEMEKSLHDFLRFIRGEEVSDSLKKSLREKEG
jgi:hypothetical protein